MRQLLRIVMKVTPRIERRIAPDFYIPLEVERYAGRNGWIVDHGPNQLETRIESEWTNDSNARVEDGLAVNCADTENFNRRHARRTLPQDPPTASPCEYGARKRM